MDRAYYLLRLLDGIGDTARLSIRHLAFASASEICLSHIEYLHTKLSDRATVVYTGGHVKMQVIGEQLAQKYPNSVVEIDVPRTTCPDLFSRQPAKLRFCVGKTWVGSEVEYKRGPLGAFDFPIEIGE